MHMVDDDQSSLISALKRRNRSAWSLVVDHHSREVYGFVFHLVGGDRSIAEDLTQEIWLETVDGIDGCNEAKGTFRNWLLGIARKRVAMYYRRRASVGNPGSLSDPCGQIAELGDQSILPEDVLEQVEQNAVVRAALLLLPDDRRDVMLSKYVEGHSVKSIADRMGKTVKAVESLLTRTRQQMRSLLREYMVMCSDGQGAKEKTRNE
jgi:RNA polymerase sigma-70 factor (ECF subfamily)